MLSAVLFPGQRRSAVRRRLPRCFRCARPRGRSLACGRPSTCPSPRASRRATREPLPGPVGFPGLAPAAPPHPTPTPPLALRGWRSPREAAGSVRFAHWLGCEDRRPESPITSLHPCPSPPWPAPLPPRRLDGSSLPRIAPADPAASHPETQDTILFEGWCGVPPGWSTHLSKHWGGPAAYSREGKTDVGLRQAISAWEGGGLYSPSVYTDPARGFVENGGGTA